MTKNKQAKLAARNLSRSQGITYREAKRTLADADADAGGDGSGEPPVTAEDFTEGWDDFEPPTLYELVKDAPQGKFDDLIGETIRLYDGTLGGTGIEIDFDPPASGMSEFAVHQFEQDEGSVDVDVQEEHEGGTSSAAVTATGTLTIEAQMMKADAFVSEQAGQVSVIDDDFNEHYATVVFDVPIEATFLTQLNPETEGVSTFDLESVVVLRPARR